MDPLDGGWVVPRGSMGALDRENYFSVLAIKPQFLSHRALSQVTLLSILDPCTP